MANEDLFGLTLKCILGFCEKVIPADRLKKKSVTCSDEHLQIYKRWKRRRVDDKTCRFCHRASTPNARRSYSRFRQWEGNNPELARPEAWAIVSAAGMNKKDFGKALLDAGRNDIEIDFELRDVDWGRVKKQKNQDNPKPTPELDQALAILAAYIPPVKETANAKKANGGAEDHADLHA